MLNIGKGVSRVTGSIWKVFIPDEATARMMAKRYAAIYNVVSDKHNLYC